MVLEEFVDIHLELAFTASVCAFVTDRLTRYSNAWLPTIAFWMTILVIFLTVLRGIPVFVEARRFFGRAEEVKT